MLWNMENKRDRKIRKAWTHLMVSDTFHFILNNKLHYPLKYSVLLALLKLLFAKLLRDIFCWLLRQKSGRFVRIVSIAWIFEGLYCHFVVTNFQINYIPTNTLSIVILLNLLSSFHIFFLRNQNMYRNISKY